MERDRRFYIRLTREEYELLEKLAEEDEETHSRNKKKNMSAFIRKQIFTGSSLEQGLTSLRMWSTRYGRSASTLTRLRQKQTAAMYREKMLRYCWRRLTLSISSFWR